MPIQSAANHIRVFARGFPQSAATRRGDRPVGAMTPPTDQWVTEGLRVGRWLPMRTVVLHRSLAILTDRDGEGHYSRDGHVHERRSRYGRLGTDLLQAQFARVDLGIWTLGFGIWDLNLATCQSGGECRGLVGKRSGEDEVLILQRLLRLLSETL